MKGLKFKYVCIALSVMLASACILTSCGSDAGVVKGSDTFTGEVSFKDAFNSKGSRIWFLTSEPDGRYTKVMSALIFEDGQVTVYHPNVNSAEGLGTLEDYWELSDDEAIELIKTNYEKVYRDYYETLTVTLENEQKLLDMNTEDANDPDGNPLGILDDMYAHDNDYFTKQVQAIKDTYDTLINSTIDRPQPQDFNILIYADNTGNEAEAEEIQTTVSYPATFDGNPALDGEYYHVVDPKTDDFFFHATSGCSAFEVYDSYYGGYSRSDYYLITKCDADTVFKLDPVGTEGTEVAN